MDSFCLKHLERITFMAAQYDSRLVIRSKTAFQYPGLMEYFQWGGSVSAPSSETVDSSSVVGSKPTTAGFSRADVSSKIGERGDKIPVGSKSITVKVGAMSVSYCI